MNVITKQKGLASGDCTILLVVKTDYVMNSLTYHHQWYYWRNLQCNNWVHEKWEACCNCVPSEKRAVPQLVEIELLSVLNVETKRKEKKRQTHAKMRETLLRGTFLSAMTSTGAAVELVEDVDEEEELSYQNHLINTDGYWCTCI